MTIADLYGRLWGAQDLGKDTIHFLTTNDKGELNLHVVKGVGDIVFTTNKNTFPLEGMAFELRKPIPLSGNLTFDDAPSMGTDYLNSTLDVLTKEFPLTYPVLAHYKKTLYIPVGYIDTPASRGLVFAEAPQNLILRGALLRLDGTWHITTETLSTI